MHTKGVGSPSAQKLVGVLLGYSALKLLQGYKNFKKIFLTNIK